MKITISILILLISVPSYANWIFGDSLPPGIELPYYDDACYNTKTGELSEDRLDKSSFCDNPDTFDFDQFDGHWRHQTHQYPYASAPNGCSSGGAYLENIGPADFRPACDKHDKCYYRPNHEGAPTAKECNDAFLEDLTSVCLNAFNIRLVTCTEWKVKISTTFQKLECTNHSWTFLPGNVAGLALCGKAVAIIYGATAAAANTMAVFGDARQRQAAYEEWVTIKAQRTMNNTSSIKNIIQPTYLKIYGRAANAQEELESTDFLNSYSSVEYDDFVMSRFDQDVDHIFSKVWGMCDGCTYLYVRSASQDEQDFVVGKLSSGLTIGQVVTLYEERIRYQFISYFEQLLNQELSENFIEEHNIFGLLITHNTQDIMGRIIKSYVRKIHQELGSNIDTWSAEKLEHHLSRFAKSGYQQYKREVLTAHLIPILNILIL